MLFKHQQLNQADMSNMKELLLLKKDLDLKLGIETYMFLSLKILISTQYLLNMLKK